MNTLKYLCQNIQILIIELNFSSHMLKFVLAKQLYKSDFIWICDKNIIGASKNAKKSWVQHQMLIFPIFSLLLPIKLLLFPYSCRSFLLFKTIVKSTVKLFANWKRVTTMYCNSWKSDNYRKSNKNRKQIK